MLTPPVPSLFADYLSFVRGHPNNGLRPARTHIQLTVMAGGPAYDRGPSLATRRYWEAYARGDGMLYAWLRTKDAFRPPSSWPPDYPFPDHLTPTDFALDIFPRSQAKDNFAFGTYRYSIWHYHTPGIHQLAAYCMGWPLNGVEQRQAKEAAEHLMGVPQFALYEGYSVAHIPLRGSSPISYLKRLEQRHRLNTDPLRTSPMALNRSMPKWCQSAEDIRKHGIPLGHVGGSSLKAHVLDADGARVTRPKRR